MSSLDSLLAPLDAAAQALVSSSTAAQAAPLAPCSVRDKRTARAIAYTEANAAVGAFQPAVTKERAATHARLGDRERVALSTASLISSFVPKPGLEGDIAAILRGGGAHDDAAAAASEQKQVAKLAEAEKKTPEALLTELHALGQKLMQEKHH